MKAYDYMHAKPSEGEASWDRKPLLKEVSADIKIIRENYDQLADQISSRINALYAVDFRGD